MRHEMLMNSVRRSAVALALLALIAGPASAHDVYLVAKEYTNAASVTMWGFAEDLDGFDVGDPEGAATSPGPVIRMPVGDTTLTIWVRNDLPPDLSGNDLTDISLFIPGQSKALAPVFVTDVQGRQRVKSLDAVTVPGAVSSYTWTDVKPGSFIYQSGSVPPLQVPMGLYGALIADSGSGEAYAGVTYDNEAILFYSEVDPAVNNGGTPAGPDYKPQYFMINGASFPAAAPIWAHEPLQGETVLLRFFNAGLDTAMPMVNGLYVRPVAEDGNLLPAASMPEAPGQHSLLLPAGKTLDAVVADIQGGRYAIFDRTLRLDSGPGTEETGGQMVYLDVNTPPVAANDDAYGVDEDNLLAVAAPGVLGNDSDADLDPLTAVLDTDVTNGILNLNGDGSFTYTPNADFNGADSFTYHANDGLQDSNVATVTITVNPVNDPPVAVDDEANTTTDVAVTIDVVANDTDVDGNLDPTSVAITIAPGNGTLDPPVGGSVTYTPGTGFEGTDTFDYQVCDTDAACDTATVTIYVTAPPAP